MKALWRETPWYTNSAAAFAAFGSIFEPSGNGRKQEGPSHSSRPTAGASHTPRRWNGQGPHSSPPVLPTGQSHDASETRDVFPRRQTRTAVTAAVKAVEKPISIWHIVLRGPLSARRYRLYMRAITLQEYYHQHAKSFQWLRCS